MQADQTNNVQGWLAFDIPASQAESLFATTYYEFEHKKSADKIKVGCDSYHVPANVAHHIDYITPGVALSPALVKRSIDALDKRADPTRRWNGGGKPGHRPPMMWTKPPGPHPSQPNHPSLPSNLQNCGTNITTACLKALYNIPDAPTKVDDINALGLYEDYDTYAQSDLNLYFANYAPKIPQGTHPTLDSVDGGQAPVPAASEKNSGESEVDMQIAYSLIYPQKITLYQVDDDINSETDGEFNVFLDALDGSYCTYSAYGVTGNTFGVDPVYPDPAPGGYKGQLMCGTYKPTRVISVSYGVSEIDAPLNYTKRQCNEFLKLGLQGVTFVWASGDYGVASYPGDDSDSGCLGPQESVYNPSFPTCPYVTNVGATRLYDSQTVLDKESALQAVLTDAPNFASAGGFANYFPVPKYQQSAVSSYFASHDPGLPYYTAHTNSTNVTNIGQNGGVYNRAGRGFPDVSANGARFLAYDNSTVHAFYGTSLAAPIWGSIMTLINQARTDIGKGPVGFINAVL